MISDRLVNIFLSYEKQAFHLDNMAEGYLNHKKKFLIYFIKKIDFYNN